MGDVLGDLSSRRGKIGGMTQRGEAQVIAATVPLGEMFGYSTKLRIDVAGPRRVLDWNSRTMKRSEE
jgi:elongation factor G